MVMCNQSSSRVKNYKTYRTVFQRHFNSNTNPDHKTMCSSAGEKMLKGLKKGREDQEHADLLVLLFHRVDIMIERARLLDSTR